MIAEHVDTLVIARLATTPMQRAGELATALARYAPTASADRTWPAEVLEAVDRLRARAVLGPGLVDPHELSRRTGAPARATWAQLTDRFLPALGLGLAPSDAKASERLVGRDAWAAAIAGRALGLWREGPPPSLAAVCDAHAWTSLGLRGRAKRCPPEVRALFLQRALDTEAGPPDRLVRLVAARAVDAPRTELRALRDALVRRWLAGAPLAEGSPAGSGGGPAALVDAVHAAARRATQGVFGDRKVFISTIYELLRGEATWAALTLPALKEQLYAAHREGTLELTRADLVAAMDPALVAASETAIDGATFHFVVRTAVE